MDNLLGRIQIKVNESLYAKDPLGTDLGKSILKSSAILIDKIGFESFTFKKLATELKTTESSIYRYFENKHNLLIYLISWYWGYMEYMVVFSSANLSDPVEKLIAIIDTLCKPIKVAQSNDFISQEEINRIIVAESPKVYLTKDVDDENRNGFFLTFKQPCYRLAKVLEEINPDYPFPHSLASTVVEGIISQKYFDLHLSSLTDFNEQHEGVNEFYKDLVLNTIRKKH